MKAQNNILNDNFSLQYEELPITCKEEYNLEGGDNVKIVTIRVKIDNFDDLIQKTIDILWDMSWMNQMLSEADAGISEMRAQATQRYIIPKIKECIGNSENQISSTFKEYAISICSQGALRKNYGCKVYPLSELLKEKVANNAGFDYLVLMPNANFVFGESKYRAKGSAHLAACIQIIKFIRNEKHISDCEVLQKFDKNAYQKCKKQNKYDLSIGFSLSRMRLQNCLNKIKETLTAAEELNGHTVYSIIIENDGLF